MPRPTFSKGLVSADIDAMSHAEVVARLAGCPLAWFLTVTPLRHIPNAERPAIFNEANNREWKFLTERGNGYPHCALRTREHPRYDERLVGLHQHSCHWQPDDLSPEGLIRAMLGGSDYEWQGHKLVGQNKKVNVALEANEGTFGIISRVAYMGKERHGQFQGWLNTTGQLKMSVKKGGQFWKWEPTTEVLNPRYSATKGLRGLIAADTVEQERRPRVYLGARLTPPKAEPTPTTEPLTATVACEDIKQTNSPNIMVKKSLFDALDVAHAPPKSKRVPRRREKKPQSSLPMPFPPDIPDMLERLHLKMTDAEIAEQLRISRPQATNIRNRQFGASRQVRCRVLELARAA